jgi:hypothetical protein
MYRLLPLCLVALALVVFVGAPLLADNPQAPPNAAPDPHDGKFVNFDGNKFTMMDKDGKTKHTHTLARDAKIICDGKECKLADLKEGLAIRVWTEKDNKDVALKVEAKTKGDFDKEEKK